MRIALAVAILTLYYATSYAQRISGVTHDDQSHPLAGSSITLKKSQDSSVVKYSLSNNEGKFTFSGIAKGTYFLDISHAGYTPLQSHPFEMQEGQALDLPGFALIKIARELGAAVVSGQKPPVEVHADKIIVNVENSINAVGQDALELLRKSPGVIIDKDDNLSFNGKNGVQIFIDGRPSPLSGKDLSEYLKTIQSSSVESIELIANPSAKYEAAGNAGIINIRLKKNKAFGTNGSVNAGYGIGTYSKYNAGISLNHRDKRLNLFGNYNYANNIQESYGIISRHLLDSLFDNHSRYINKPRNHNLKAGLDWSLDDKNTFGIILSGSYSTSSLRTDSRTPISYVPTGAVDRILEANNSAAVRRDNTSLNINHRYADTLGHELNVNADYGYYHLNNDQLQPNNYFTPDGTPLYSRVYNMLSPTRIDIYSLKTDYEQKLGKGKLGLGFKTSYVRTSNDFQQFNVFPSYKEKDTLRSNNFNYKENINAVYANYNRSWKGWAIQGGLRIENTNIHGISTGYKEAGSGYDTYDSAFSRHYTNFFPSASITWNKNPKRQWTLTYSRRIDRPAYQDLNPFEFKLDEYTYQKGNPLLRPQYTNSVGLTFSYNYKLTATLNYSHVKDIFTQIFDTTESSRSFAIQRNLASQDIASLNVSYPLEIAWYRAFTNLNSYYSLYKANFGAGRTVDVNVFVVSLYVQQTARLGKGFTAEVNTIYNSPSVALGTFRSNHIWSVDGGISKSIFHQAGSLKMSVSDIFHTLRWTAVSNFAGQTVNVLGRFESRQFKASFTYRFGSSQIKAARQHKSGAEEESRRVGSGQSGGTTNN